MITEEYDTGGIALPGVQDFWNPATTTVLYAIQYGTKKLSYISTAVIYKTARIVVQPSDCCCT